MPHKKLTRAKAKKILKHGTVKGRKLTKKQRGFFGARAGGSPVRRKKRAKSKRKTRRPSTRKR